MEELSTRTRQIILSREQSAYFLDRFSNTENVRDEYKAQIVVTSRTHTKSCEAFYKAILGKDR